MANGNGAAFSETYDARLRPAAIAAAVNGANILNLAYTYDRDSNVTQLAQAGVTNENYTETFGYDALNRISSAASTGTSGTSSWAQNFGYNGDGSGGRFGNVTCTSAGGPPCAQLTFDQSTNRITSIGGATPTYDNAGEMTSDGTGTGTTQYTWTGDGRVATVTPWGGTPTTYVYDAEGRRVEDTAANRLFWYGASGNLLEATDAGTTNHDYIYFAGRRIARHDSSGAVYYLYDDANGSLRTATDASGAQLCWADYYPFGEPAAGTGCSLDNYQFAGLYADATGEDGNYSAAHRRYNDTYYRWLSPDPGGRKVVKLDNPQTWNMYAYVTNNPTTENDPSGEACFFGITIFGSYFGGRCASDTPPPPPPPPPPPEGAVGTATFGLITAQDQARANPAFQPTPPPNRKTFCNLATCSIASKTGVPTAPLENGHGVPLLANQQAASLLHSGQYHQVSPGEAQALADQGVTVFAAQVHAGHGHIATVRPNNTYFAPYENQDPGGRGPMINNIGGQVGIVPQSGAFYSKPPVIYIAPNNPNQ